MQIMVYYLEQLFPDQDKKKGSWFETGEEYDKVDAIHKRLDQLKKDGKTGFRAIRKIMDIEILESI